jgi:hypothetical protein
MQELPFSRETLRKIEGVLQKEDLFVLFDPSAEVYNLGFYISQKSLHDTTTVALIDRNILKDVIPIVEDSLSGNNKSCPERCRIGAALMAFLQAGSVLIEPSVALYEQRPNAERELQLFRCADSIDPRLYASLSEGKIDTIPKSAIPPLDHEGERFSDGSGLLCGNEAMRVAMLKLADIDLSDRSPTAKMNAFLEWSYWEFCLATLPILVACRQFAPGHLQRGAKPLLRGHRVKNRENALLGVENALWDIQLIKEWSRKVQMQAAENRLWILCSRDAALRDIARVVHNAEKSSVDSGADPLDDFFVRYWGESDGLSFARRLRTWEGEEKEHPKRRSNQGGFDDTWEDLAEQSREKILAWRPSR